MSFYPLSIVIKTLPCYSLYVFNTAIKQPYWSILMRIGVSTSCFYPMETELSFQTLAEQGVEVCEVFFNTWSELEEPILRRLLKIKDEYAIHVPAVHPFFSFAEHYLLFSEYERRFYDALDLFEKYFEAAQALGAKILIIHGAKANTPVDDKLYFERFAKLMERGKPYGVRVAQENVVHYLSESPGFLAAMGEYIGDDFSVVLDIKQALRAGRCVNEYIETLPESIVHVHLSDYTPAKDCVPPGEGEFDFKQFFKRMEEIKYGGEYIVELYRHSFTDEKSPARSADFLSKYLHKNM